MGEVLVEDFLDLLLLALDLLHFTTWERSISILFSKDKKKKQVFQSSEN